MAKAYPIHKTALLPVLDLLSYQKLRRRRLNNSSEVLNKTEKVVIITDCADSPSLLLTDIKFLCKKIGSDRIKLLTLDSALPQGQYPKGITPISLCGQETSGYNEVFLNLIEVLMEFSAETYIIRIKNSHSALRRILLRIIPEIRISIGISLPFPYCNITLSDSDAVLEEYFK